MSDLASIRDLDQGQLEALRAHLGEALASSMTLEDTYHALKMLASIQRELERRKS